MATEPAEVRRQVERAVLSSIRSFYPNADADGSLGSQIDISGTKGGNPDQLIELMAGDIKRKLVFQGFTVMVRIDKEKQTAIGVYTVDGIRVTVVMPT